MLVGIVAMALIAAPSEIRIVTYNIHAGKAVDGSNNLARVADIVKTADIVALQEVDRNTRRSGGVDQLEVIRRALPGFDAKFGKAISFDNGEFGVAILTRHKVRSFVAHALPGEWQDKKGEERAALEAVIEIKGRPIRVVSTHLEHRYAPLRLHQAERILALPKGMPTIIAGDLNSAPDSPLLKQFRAQYVDAFGESKSATFPGTGARIDYILLDKESSWISLSTRVLDFPGVSDHLPAEAVVKLNSTGPSD